MEDSSVESNDDSEVQWSVSEGSRSYHVANFNSIPAVDMTYMSQPNLNHRTENAISSFRQSINMDERRGDENSSEISSLTCDDSYSVRQNSLKSLNGNGYLIDSTPVEDSSDIYDNHIESLPQFPVRNIPRNTSFSNFDRGNSLHLPRYIEETNESSHSSQSSHEDLPSELEVPEISSSPALRHSRTNSFRSAPINTCLRHSRQPAMISRHQSFKSTGLNSAHNFRGESPLNENFPQHNIPVADDKTPYFVETQDLCALPVETLADGVHKPDASEWGNRNHQIIYDNFSKPQEEEEEVPSNHPPNPQKAPSIFSLFNKAPSANSIVPLNMQSSTSPNVSFMNNLLYRLSNLYSSFHSDRETQDPVDHTGPPTDELDSKVKLSKFMKKPSKLDEWFLLQTAPSGGNNTPFIQGGSMEYSQWSLRFVDPSLDKRFEESVRLKQTFSNFAFQIMVPIALLMLGGSGALLVDFYRKCGFSSQPCLFLSSYKYFSYPVSLVVLLLILSMSITAFFGSMRFVVGVKSHRWGNDLMKQVIRPTTQSHSNTNNLPSNTPASVKASTWNKNRIPQQYPHQNIVSINRPTAFTSYRGNPNSDSIINDCFADHASTSSSDMIDVNASYSSGHFDHQVSSSSLNHSLNINSIRNVSKASLLNQRSPSVSKPGGFPQPNSRIVMPTKVPLIQGVASGREKFALLSSFYKSAVPKQSIFHFFNIVEEGLEFVAKSFIEVESMYFKFIFWTLMGMSESVFSFVCDNTEIFEHGCCMWIFMKFGNQSGSNLSEASINHVYRDVEAQDQDVLNEDRVLTPKTMTSDENGSNSSNSLNNSPRNYFSCLVGPRQWLVSFFSQPVYIVAASLIFYFIVNVCCLVALPFLILEVLYRLCFVSIPNVIDSSFSTSQLSSTVNSATNFYLFLVSCACHFYFTSWNSLDISELHQVSFRVPVLTTCTLLIFPMFLQQCSGIRWNAMVSFEVLSKVLLLGAFVLGMKQSQFSVFENMCLLFTTYLQFQSCLYNAIVVFVAISSCWILFLVPNLYLIQRKELQLFAARELAVKVRVELERAMYDDHSLDLLL